MGKDGSVVEHNNEFNVVISQLDLIKIDFDDEICALILLFSQYDSWNTIVNSVTIYSESRSLTSDEVHDLIQSEGIHGKKMVNPCLLMKW